MKLVTNLKLWFFDVVRPVHASDDVKTYIIDVLARPECFDMSHESVVIATSRATSFVDYQKIGDWALWIGTINPDYRNRETIESLGRHSYLSCYRLLGRRVLVYEELADELPHIVDQVHVRLNVCAQESNYELNTLRLQGRHSS